MRLLIVRHAIAVPRGTPGIEDDERPLTRRGIARFRTAAKGLAAACPRPDVLFTSPLIRARQTADIAARAWGKIEPETMDALGGGSVSEILSALEAHHDKGLVAVVGHEPDVSELVARLLGTKATDRLTFKKGGAALVDVPGPFADGGTLLWFAPPRILRAAKG
jgi:phosphohistidine phosphatase